MGRNRRVVFTFDERSFDSLEQIKERGRFGSLAEAVRESLQISRALQDQSNRGFSQIVVRNPDTGEERIMVVPALITGEKEN